MSSTIPDSFQAEYVALTDGCGFVILKDWSTVALMGDDRTGFLHNMCTNDIRKLAAEEGCEAFCTNVQGKIVAHVYVIATEHRLELLTVPVQSSALVEHLERYIIREDIQLNDDSATVDWVLISGVNSLELLDRWLPGAASQLEQPWRGWPCMVDGVDFLAVRANLVGPNNFLLRCEADKTAWLCQSLVGAGAVSCNLAAWTALRVESGLPLFGVDFDSSNLPQEVSRDRLAISFNKGCYLGQETIARIDALGHVNKQLVRLQFSGDTLPKPGTAILSNEQRVGEVTTVCWSPKLESPLALAMVRRGWNEPGQQLDSEFGMATVVSPKNQDVMG